MDTDTGLVHDVSLYAYGSWLVAAASVGATTLAVEDAADFDETGGVLAVVTSTDGVTFNTEQIEYTAADLDTDTLTLAVPLVTAAEEGDRVDVWPRQEEKRAVVVIAGLDDAITARVPHSLAPLMEEGIRDDTAREPVDLTLVRDEWVVTNLPNQAPALRSSSYLEGDDGWSLDDSGVQMSSANVIGVLGASTVSTDQLIIGADDVTTLFGNTPDGLVAAGRQSGVTNTNPTAGESIHMEFNAGAMYNARYYLILCRYSLTSDGVDNDIMQSQIRYTTDGTTPTLSSNVLSGSTQRMKIHGNFGNSFNHVLIYSPTEDYDTVRFAVTGLRVSGTGTFSIKMGDPGYQFQFAVVDLGLQANVGGQIAQRSYLGGGSDAAPGATYTRTFTATESQSYDGDDSKRAGGDGDNCYQGYYDGTHGRQSSVVCFDDAAIRAALVGASIVKVVLTFRVKKAYYGYTASGFGSGGFGGVNVRIRDHNFSTPPTTYNDTAGSLRGSADHCFEGGTRKITLDVSFGNMLRDGTARGFAFTAPNSDKAFYGYHYGPGSGSAPQLTITYSK
jgi:hypothetical protein